MTTQSFLSEKGYCPLWKGKSKTPLYMTESNAKKIAKDLHRDGFNAQAVKSNKVAPIGGEPYWIVMTRKKRRSGALW